MPSSEQDGEMFVAIMLSLRYAAGCSFRYYATQPVGQPVRRVLSIFCYAPGLLEYVAKH